MNTLKVFAGTFYYLQKNRAVLFRVLWVPLGVYLLTESARILDVNKWLDLLLIISTLFIHTILAIVTHRVLLIGPKAVGQHGLTRWTKRETSFLLHLFGLALILVPAIFAARIPTIGYFVCIVGSVWLVGRVSLVFPAIAIGKPLSFQQSWQLTKGHQLLMVMTVGVLPLLVYMPIMLLNRIPNTFFLIIIIIAFVYIASTAALSMAYQLIISQAQHE